MPMYCYGQQLQECAAYYSLRSETLTISMIYAAGIGTYVVSSGLGHHGFRRRISSWYAKAKDSAIGSSFDQHVVGGYRFLMRFYTAGDEIYIFGFSRGAYIARFIAEMLDYVGLLSHGNEEMVSFAWKAFSQWQCRRTDNSPEGKKKKHEMYRFLQGFRETFSRPVRRIRFLGLFDTVNSVPRFETAWMERSKFPYTARSSAKVIRHAVSIDERRAKFRQDLMYQSAKADAAKEEQGKYREKPATRRGRDPNRNLKVPGAGNGGKDEEEMRYRPRSRSTIGGRSRSRASQADSTPAPMNFAGSESSDENEQDIDEVWFAGGHGDVGGGWDVPSDGKSASHVPLVWMVREAMLAGLSFDMEKVVDMGCAVSEDVLEGDHHEAEQDQRPVPDIIVRSPSGSSPTMLSKPISDEDHHPFHHLMHKAHTAMIHDSLSFRPRHQPVLTTFSWRIMEYLPFRRMDLQHDGTWKPIRWPLPCGEVRDIPTDVRVHGSVIRRMMADEKYRPGNLIMGGGGRGKRKAPEEYGIGKWVCVKDRGHMVGEVWMRKGAATENSTTEKH